MGILPDPAISVAAVCGDNADDVYVRVVDVNVIVGHNGKLGVLEGSNIGFDPKRVYFLTDLDEGAARGGHAHKRLKQCFICLRGSVTIEFVRDGRSTVVDLSDYRQGLVVEPGCWRDLRNFRNDALLLVLASEEYQEDDYIRDFSEFRRWEHARRNASMVPYNDLSRGDDKTDLEISRAVENVVRSGIYIGGPAVAAFERDFAAYSESAECVGVANGLEALSLTLRAWGIGPGDEVIVPAHTFIATALAVTETGAKPVLVDVEDDTGLIDLDRVEAAITPRTRAIIPVHLYGHPVDMDRLNEIAARNNIRVLEDAAQAHGARYKGRRVGGLGDAAAFSFYPTKNLGALGDAGAVVTRTRGDLNAVRQLGNYGSREKYVHEMIGTNSRLDPIQAAVLSVKLSHLDRWNTRRRELAGRYVEGLAGIPDLSLTAVRDWAEPVWHVFPVKIANGRRNAVQSSLAARGIGTNLHYPVPVHLQPCYIAADDALEGGAFPNAERWGAEVLSLPLSPAHSVEEIDRVITAVRAVLA